MVFLSTIKIVTLKHFSSSGKEVQLFEVRVSTPSTTEEGPESNLNSGIRKEVSSHRETLLYHLHIRVGTPN